MFISISSCVHPTLPVSPRLRRVYCAIDRVLSLGFRVGSQVNLPVDYQGQHNLDPTAYLGTRYPSA